MKAPENEVLEEETRRSEAEAEEGSGRRGAPGREAEGPGQAGQEASAADEAVAEPGPEAACADEPEDGPDALALLEAERDHLKDQHLRLAADFGNYRRRTEGLLQQRWSRAQADLVGRLLDPLDDLRRVTALEPESTASVDAIVEGVDLVERKFFRALEEAGVEVVDPEGERFDPNTMEAMMRMATDDETSDETVAQVFQRGYTMKGILIRPARVSVFKAE